MQASDIRYSDTIIKAISELHKIELSIFSMWKQLPNLDTVTDEVNAIGLTTQIKHEQLQQKLLEEQEEEGYESTQIPPVDDEDERGRFDLWSEEAKPMSDQYRARMEGKFGLTVEPWDQPSWIQCTTCSRW